MGVPPAVASRGVRELLRPPAAQPVSLAVALVDLLESADVRERHAAAQRLEPLHLAGGE